MIRVCLLEKTPLLVFALARSPALWELGDGCRPRLHQLVATGKLPYE